MKSFKKYLIEKSSFSISENKLYKGTNIVGDCEYDALSDSYWLSIKGSGEQLSFKHEADIIDWANDIMEKYQKLGE